MNPRYLIALAILLFALPVLAQVLDGDGDGVPDEADACPAEDASFFDMDADGCIDPTANTRHLEFWATADLPLTYLVNEDGAPGVGDGSDILAIQAGFDTWGTVPGSDLSALYGGTTTDAAGDGLDGINLVSFADPDFVAIYGNAVLAVGVTTSFETPTNFNGNDVLPGQIVDADMLFNPTRSFATDTTGSGIDMQSVAVHEAGHLFGISHSSIESATMFPALPLGTAARTLETDDQVMAYMANPDPATLPAAAVLTGTVTNGATLAALPGAAVFAISVATGDTSGCQYTLPDGSYNLMGLDPGEYHVSIHPLDGSAAIKGVTPGFINELVENTAETLFVPEWWDLAESATDNAEDKDPITLTSGATTTVDIISNVDADPPVITSAEPETGQTGVRTDALVLVEFDEPVDFDSAVSRFHFDRMDLSGPVSLGGSLVAVSNGTVLVFNPSAALAYDSTFRVRLDAGVEDVYGNPTTTQFVSTFLSEAQPAVAVSSLLPVKGVSGSLVTISGVGFEGGAGGNTVLFGSVPATVLSAAPNRIVVTTPDGVIGDAQVTVEARGQISLPVLFTVLTNQAPLEGQTFSATPLAGAPEAVELLPDGNFAYVATSAGVSSVSLNPAVSDYGQEIATIALPGGTIDVTIAPDGRRAYALSQSPGALHVIDSDYDDLDNRNPLFNQVLDTVPIDGTPLGIATDPGGQRAYVTTSEGIVLIYDIVRTVLGSQTQESLTLHRVVDEIVAPSPNLNGAVAVDPSGERVMLATGAGELLIYDTALNAQGTHTLLSTATIGPNPRGIDVDPQGLRAYVSDSSGLVSLVDYISGAGLSPVITGGSPRGVVLSPTAAVAYVADRANDQLTLIDLVSGSLTFRSVGGMVDTGAQPVDVAVSSDGVFTYVAEKGSNALGFVGVGFGPTVSAVAPPEAKPGDTVVVQGEGFFLWDVGQTASIQNPRVWFDGVQGTVVYSTGTALEAIVPTGFTGGTVQIQNVGGGVSPGVPEDPYSNAIPMAVPDPYSSFDAFVYRTEFTPALGYDWSFIGVHNLVKASPRGDIVLIAQDGGDQLAFFDTRPGSATFQQTIKVADLGYGANDVEFTPDGTRAYISTNSASPSIDILDTDILSPTFGTSIGAVDFSLSGNLAITHMVMIRGSDELVGLTPNARLCWVDVRPGSSNRDELVAVTASVLDLPIVYLSAHPSGRAIYAVEANGQGGQIYSIGTYPVDEGYRSLYDTLFLENTPLAMEISPDGSTAYIATANIVGLDSFELVRYEIDQPVWFGNYIDQVTVDANGGQGVSSILVSPNGERVFVDTVLELVEYNVTTDPPTLRFRHNVNGTGQPLGYDMVADGSRLYTASFADTYPRTLTRFRSEFWGVGGKDQSGEAGQTLSQPITVSVANGDLTPTQNFTVFVSVSEGSGLLPNGTQFQVFETDSQGKLSFDWTLGSEITPVPAPATPTHELEITLPITVTGTIVETVVATAVEDPGTLPLSLNTILPNDGSTALSVNTAAQASFTRDVDPATITPSSFYLREVGESVPVPVAYGFADGGRKVSMTPLVPLDFSTQYEVQVEGTIQDGAGGSLTNPDAATFTTKDPPPLSIASISPPAGIVGSQMTISGEGFDADDPSGNVVSLGPATASVVSASVSALQVVIPPGATSGPIVVQALSQTVTGPTYNVLVPTSEPLDEILATVETGITTQGMALTPDGSKAYSVSTATNSVVPLNLTTLVSGSPIAVGNTPVGIVINPAGTRAYVVNFVSGTVSVIDLSTDTVATTIGGFINPFDIIMAPDGDNVYVIDTFDNSVNVIDTDEGSGTFHGVTTRLTAGESTKGAAITPDGTLLYLGTSDGFLVFNLDPNEFGVTTRLTTGESTKGAAITPDGTLLILLTDLGNIIIVDISPSGNNQVTTRLTAGDSTKGAAVSPDGTLLYLIQGDSDEILVYQIEVIGSVSAVEHLGLRVQLTQVNSFDAGVDPQYVVFDPQGTGLTVVGNGGSTGGVTLVNSSDVPAGEIGALISIEPDPVTLQAPNKEVEVCISLPAAFDPADIRLDSLRLMGDCPMVPTRSVIEDRNGDGLDDLCVTVDVFQFFKCLPPGDTVEVIVSGELDPDGSPFSGSATIRTYRAVVFYPCEGDEFFATDTITAIWTNPQDLVIGRIALKWSPDGGLTWSLVADDVGLVESYDWTVPMRPTHEGMFCVTIYDDKNRRVSEGICGPFRVVDPSVPVAMQEMTLMVEGGSGSLQWKTANYAVEGFHVLRSEEESQGFARVSSEPVRPVFDGSSLRFDFVDENIRANRNYYYMLEEVRGGGQGFQHGPYKLSYIVANALEQNYPNPYNPVTTIRFSIAERSKTRLTVYNLAGRKVRTLVDGELAPDNYAIQWFGRDDNDSEVASGVYLYALETDKGYRRTMKMVLVR